MKKDTIDTLRKIRNISGIILLISIVLMFVFYSSFEILLILRWIGEISFLVFVFSAVLVWVSNWKVYKSKEKKRRRK